MGRADIEVPNAPVDVGSRGTLACYPRSTFYPVIDGPPTWNHRVTKPCFRTCSACLPHSQAPFCLCTLHTVSNRAEGTLGSLRYPSGGDHPSQTTHLSLSPPLRELVLKQREGGISPAAPPWLAPGLLSLPPILHTPCPSTTTGCSEGSGVFPSRRGYSASSPRLQFRRARGQDSAALVGPFMQVGTYPTRNFATLGPL